MKKKQKKVESELIGKYPDIKSDKKKNELDELFKLCQNSNRCVDKFDLLTIMKALGILFSMKELYAVLKKNILNFKENDQTEINFELYQKMLNNLYGIEGRREKQKQETFSLFEKKKVIDIEEMKSVLMKIGNKLSEADFRTFFEELQEYIKDNKIESRYVYDLISLK